MNPETKRRRIVIVLALLASAGAFAYLAWGNIGDSLVYYWSPTELMEAGEDAHSATVRLGGLVAPGTLVRGSDGLTLEFSVTDGETTVPVRAKTVPPAMFREGIGVVLEGSLGSDGNFATRRLMVKHDNEYQAPDTEDDRDVDELIKTLQFET